MVSAEPSHPAASTSDSAEVAELKRQLQWAHLKIQVLEERLRLQRIKKYGPGSEKLSNAQMELLELEPGVSNLEVQAESQREPLPERAKTERQRKHPGWRELPAALPRVERVIACAPEQCQCQSCGETMAVIGYDQSEQLDVEPAGLWLAQTPVLPDVTVTCPVWWRTVVPSDRSGALAGS